MITTCAREQIELQANATAQQPDVAPDNSLASNLHSLLRRQLWSAVIATLNDSKLPYCILGAPEGIAQAADSDVDFAVQPSHYRHVSQLVALAAASIGGRLVQAIEHEITATYFAIARQEGEVVAFLHPDCTTDYRRQGRLWISSKELLRGRRRVGAGYFRPAPDTDFKYYLTKQVLKQTLSHSQWMKLTALYQAADHPQQAFSWWRPETAEQIERCLLHNDRDAFRDLLPRLRRELSDTPSPESPLDRPSFRARDAARLLGRIVLPTGLLLRISGGDPQQRNEFGRSLANTVAPAFRRACTLDSRNVVKIARALVESTLLVSTDSLMPVPRFFTAVDLRWQREFSPGQNVEYAIAAVLSHLSQRTMRRLNLQSASFQVDHLAETTAF